MNEYSCNYDYNKLKFDCTMKHVSLSVNKIVGYSILQLHGKDKCKFNTLMIQVNVNNLDGHSPGFTELIWKYKFQCLLDILFHRILTLLTIL